MAYDSFAKMAQSKSSFGSNKQYQYSPQKIKGSPFTLVCLLDNIVPSISDLARNISENLGSSLYLFGPRDTVPNIERNEFRIPTQNYKEENLTRILKNSIPIYISDCSNHNDILYITGQNHDLVTEIYDNLSSYYFNVDTTLSSRGANNLSHPANQYSNAKGIQLEFSQDFIRYFNTNPDNISNIGSLIAESADAYWNSLSQSQQKDALKRGNLKSKVIQDFKDFFGL